MSEVAEESLVARIISLCKEYSETVSGIRKEAESLSVRWAEPGAVKVNQVLLPQFHALYFAFSSLEPKLQKLARTASQRIEHSQLELGEQLELEVRLADLESRLTQTRSFLNDLMAFIK